MSKRVVWSCSSKGFMLHISICDQRKQREQKKSTTTSSKVIVRRVNNVMEQDYL